MMPCVLYVANLLQVMEQKVDKGIWVIGRHSDRHHICVEPWQCSVAKDTQVSIATLAGVKYFSHWLSQWLGPHQ